MSDTEAAIGERVQLLHTPAGVRRQNVWFATFVVVMVAFAYVVALTVNGVSTYEIYQADDVTKLNKAATVVSCLVLFGSGCAMTYSVIAVQFLHSLEGSNHHKASIICLIGTVCLLAFSLIFLALTSTFKLCSDSTCNLPLFIVAQFLPVFSLFLVFWVVVKR